MRIFKNHHDGFTLIEVIVTLIVLAVAIGMMATYFGTAISHSADPVGRLISTTGPNSAHQIMEKIALQYSRIPHWNPGTAYAVNDIVIPTTPNSNGFQYICTAAGTSNATIPAVEPSWPIAAGGTFTESTGVIWSQNGVAPTLTDLQTSINTNQTNTVFGGNYTVNQNGFIKFDPTNSNTELTITSTDPAYGRYLKVRITDTNSPATTQSALFVLR